MCSLTHKSKRREISEFQAESIFRWTRERRYLLYILTVMPLFTVNLICLLCEARVCLLLAQKTILKTDFMGLLFASSLSRSHSLHIIIAYKFSWKKKNLLKDDTRIRAASEAKFMIKSPRNCGSLSSPVKANVRDTATASRHTTRLDLTLEFLFYSQTQKGVDEGFNENFN